MTYIGRWVELGREVAASCIWDVKYYGNKYGHLNHTTLKVYLNCFMNDIVGKVLQSGELPEMRTDTGRRRAAKYVQIVGIRAAGNGMNAVE